MDAWKLYRENGPEALWAQCLGYLDMDTGQYMELQHRLLEEQLRALGESKLGELVLGGARPTNAEEMRDRLPLTTYDTYEPLLGGRREDLLAASPTDWVRTSGRSGTGTEKWAPIMPGQRDAMRWVTVAILLLSTARERGDVTIREGESCLNMMAPPPYASGTMWGEVVNTWPIRFFPPRTPEMEQLAFEQRRGVAFQMAVTEGIEYVASLGSVLQGIGEGFADRKPPGSLLSRMRNPRAFGRMGRGALRARLAGRRMYPRDVWNIRGAITGGTDNSLFRERIREYWGVYPTDVLASTEAGVIAAQAWDHQAMTLVPTLNFFEFVPEDELVREDADPAYEPRTQLLDELESGRNYELVLTSLAGGPFVRYRTGDIIRVTALQSSATGIRLPQIAHYSRRSDLIEIGSFVRITESTIAKAIEGAGVSSVDWTARKETAGDTPVLRLRVEPRPGGAPVEQEAQRLVHEQLRALDSDWADMEAMAGLTPLRVTYLPHGSFEGYTRRRVAQGAELAHLKPVHMNPSEEVIAFLQEAADEAALSATADAEAGLRT